MEGRGAWETRGHVCHPHLPLPYCPSAFVAACHPTDAFCKTFHGRRKSSIVANSSSGSVTADEALRSRADAFASSAAPLPELVTLRSTTVHRGGTAKTSGLNFVG